MSETTEKKVLYEVEVEEILRRTVTVELPPNSRYEAVEAVKKMYRDEEIVLDYQDLVDHSIKVTNVINQ